MYPTKFLESNKSVFGMRKNVNSIGTTKDKRRYNGEQIFFIFAEI